MEGAEIENYPEGWSIEVLSIVADGEDVVSEIRVPHGEPPSERSQWVEAM